MNKKPTLLPKQSCAGLLRQMEIQLLFRNNVPKDVLFLKGASPDPNLKPNLGPFGNTVFSSDFLFPDLCDPGFHSIVDHLFEVVASMRLCFHFIRAWWPV